ncbi:MAG: hypothetical protein ACLP7Q_04150 [Isosphaeraceae bacterium]
MSQIYTGQIRDGMVVFDGTPPPLPSGTRVRIELIIPEDIGASSPENTVIAGTRGLLLNWARLAEAIAPPMPADLATEHDHYAHDKRLAHERS